MAALIKGFEIENLPAVINFLSRQVTKLGISVNLGRDITSDEILKLDPNVVIVVKGGLDTTPSIPGIENKIIVHGERLHENLMTLLRIFSPKIFRWLTSR